MRKEAKTKKPLVTVMEEPGSSKGIFNTSNRTLCKYRCGPLVSVSNNQVHPPKRLFPADPSYSQSDHRQHLMRLKPRAKVVAEGHDRILASWINGRYISQARLLSVAPDVLTMSSLSFECRHMSACPMRLLVDKAFRGDWRGCAVVGAEKVPFAKYLRTTASRTRKGVRCERARGRGPIPRHVRPAGVTAH